MNPLALLSLLAKAGAVLKFGKIVWNSAKIYRFAKKFGPVAGELIKTQRLPNGEQSKEFLQATADLIRSEIVDFPGVDEDDLAKKIEQLAAEVAAK